MASSVLDQWPATAAVEIARATRSSAALRVPVYGGEGGGGKGVGVS